MEKGKTDKKDKTKPGSFLAELFSGVITTKVIIKNLWYILLITFLAAIYIGNRFHAEKITREANRLQQEVKELRSESLSTSAELMYVSRQSEVYRMVREKELNLEELKSPPYKLLVDK